MDINLQAKLTQYNWKFRGGDNEWISRWKFLKSKRCLLRKIKDSKFDPKKFLDWYFNLLCKLDYMTFCSNISLNSNYKDQINIKEIGLATLNYFLFTHCRWKMDKLINVFETSLKCSRKQKVWKIPFSSWKAENLDSNF